MARFRNHKQIGGTQSFPFLLFLLPNSISKRQNPKAWVIKRQEGRLEADEFKVQVASSEVTASSASCMDKLCFCGCCKKTKQKTNSITGQFKRKK